MMPRLPSQDWGSGIGILTPGYVLPNKETV
jgi:hypothetical protein